MHERYELSTPGLRDECSNHWDNEANKLACELDKTNKQRSTLFAAPWEIWTLDPWVTILVL